jgi:hypothetical protein
MRRYRTQARAEGEAVVNEIAAAMTAANASFVAFGRAISDAMRPMVDSLTAMATNDRFMAALRSMTIAPDDGGFMPTLAQAWRSGSDRVVKNRDGTIRWRHADE